MSHKKSSHTGARRHEVRDLLAFMAAFIMLALVQHVT